MYAECPGCAVLAVGAMDADAAAGTAEMLEGSCTEGAGADGLLKGTAETAAGGAAVLAAA